MSKKVNGIITWLRGWFDDVYALKSEIPIGNTNSAIVDLIYPVGSIYMSVNTTNPATLFGGTWVQIKDRFLLAKGDSYTSNGATGGEANHTLTTNEIPSHSHNLNNRTWGWGANDATESVQATVQAGYWGWNALTNKWGVDTVTQNTGGGKAHNNMPPYLVVNIWKRTK